MNEPKETNNSTDSHEEQGTEEGLRVIKKYPNRRVYDTSTSKYIRVHDIREMVVNGIDFKVIDSQSKKDITRSVLLQIIFDQESETNPLFSSENLKNFIRYSELKNDTFSTYLTQSLQYFNQQQQEMTRYLSDNFSVNALNPFSQENRELWQTMQKNFMDSMAFPTQKTQPEDKNKED